MEFKDLIKARRSVRHFNNKEVSDEEVLQIIEAGRICQSARNRQPWYIKVLRGDEKNKIADLMDEKNDSSISLNANMVRECNVLLLVLTDNEYKDSVSDLVSLGAMIEHLCLASFYIGIGCLWNRIICQCDQEIVEYLHLESKYLVSGVLLGHYDGELKVRPRKSLEEIILK